MNPRSYLIMSMRCSPKQLCEMQGLSHCKGENQAQRRSLFRARLVLGVRLPRLVGFVPLAALVGFAGLVAFVRLALMARGLQLVRRRLHASPLLFQISGSCHQLLLF